MKQLFSPARIVFLLALTALIIGISAFSQQKDKQEIYSFRKDADTNDDTASSGKRDRYLTEKDLDKLDAAMKKLDEQMEKLEIELKKIDFNKVERGVSDALKKVDFEKINHQIEKSLKSVDARNMNEQMRIMNDKIEGQ